MPAKSKSDLIRSYFEAYMSKDRKTIETALADDFTFTSPYDDAIDKAEYFRRCWPSSDWIKESVIERIFENGDGAFVTYKVTMDDGREFRNTEFMTFEGGLLKSVDVYFGATHKDGRFVALPQAAG
jgi:ketosteroid isomerase-like protein